MKNLFRTGTIALVLSLGTSSAIAGVNWKPYTKGAVAQAETSEKPIILGFHKKGCGTCFEQERLLLKSGISFDEKSKTHSLNGKLISILRVEQKESDMNAVYEKYGFNRKKQWAAMVLLKDGKEVARLEPGITDETKIKEFLAKAN